MPQPCPVCDRPIPCRTGRPRDTWVAFWSGATSCPGCGTRVHMRPGLPAWVRLLIQLAVAAPVFVLTRPLPDPWPLPAFLLLFIPLQIALTAVEQWARWRFGVPVPLPSPRPPKPH